MTTIYTYDIYSFSDLHKDAYGRRPGNYYYEWLENSTDDERQAEWDFLCRTADQRELDRQQEEASALESLKAQLTKTMAENKVDVATAIRWMDDAYGTQGDCQYLDYHLGVKYGTIETMLGRKPLNVG